MVSPHACAVETDTLRGGPRGDPATQWTKRLGAAIAVIVGIGISIGVLTAVNASTEWTMNLDARFRSKPSLPLRTFHNTKDTTKPVWDQPPRAREIASDPQAGEDQQATSTGPTALKAMLLEHFGLEEPPSTTEAEPIKADVRQSRPESNSLSSKGPTEAQNDLKNLLLEHFGLEEPTQPNADDAPSQAAPLTTSEDAQNELQELRERLATLRKEQETNDLDAGDTSDATTEFMTQNAFQATIAAHLERLMSAWTDGTHHLQSTAAHAHAMKDQVATCIDRATDKAVETTSGRVPRSNMNAAIRWIINHCVQMP